MDPILQSALAGEPVTVSLGGQTYPLAYPMQGVILYKSETAKLDRARKLATGAPALTREAKRELRERRRTLLAEADAARPKTGEAWDDEKFATFNELLQEAMAAKAALDEDAAAGDSLYDRSNWFKISAQDDPERLLLALFIGLHIFVPSKTAGKPDEYVETLSRQQLGKLVDLRNGEDLMEAIGKALRAHLIAPSETPEEEASPNVPAPETPATETPTETPTPRK
jgi:hypothetical protein